MQLNKVVGQQMMMVIKENNILRNTIHKNM